MWLWLREDMSWILGVIGGFVLFAYGIIPTFQPSHFHRIYAAYGGIFIIMAIGLGLVIRKNSSKWVRYFRYNTCNYWSHSDILYA